MKALADSELRGAPLADVVRRLESSPAAFNEALKGSKALTIAFSVWAVYVVCRVGSAWIFS